MKTVTILASLAGLLAAQQTRREAVNPSPNPAVDRKSYSDQVLRRLRAYLGISSAS